MNELGLKPAAVKLCDNQTVSKTGFPTHPRNSKSLLANLHSAGARIYQAECNIEDESVSFDGLSTSQTGDCQTHKNDRGDRYGL